VNLPVIMAVIAGKPPAVSAPLEELAKKPEAKILSDNKDALLKAGIGLYRSQSGQLGVLFNSFLVHGDEVQAADKAGKLQELCPPYDAVALAVQKAGGAHPSLTAAGPPKGATFKQAPEATAPQAANSAPIAPQVPTAGGGPQGLPAGAQRKLAGARTAALSPGSPLTGPAPGAGRLLNSILKPVI
jgi:hypothetical protein